GRVLRRRVPIRPAGARYHHRARDRGGGDETQTIIETADVHTSPVISHPGWDCPFGRDRGTGGPPNGSGGCATPYDRAGIRRGRKEETASFSEETAYLLTTGL